MRHGTRSCYQAGCKRPECLEASAIYMRNRRRTVRRFSETLAVFCWCQSSIVDVDRSEVLACRTASCGLAGCKP